MILTVVDDDGDSDDDSITVPVVVTNQPPIADAGGPYFGYVDKEILFDGSNSTDPDGEIISYFWDFGDDTNSTGIIADHTYKKDGTYPVILTVTDDQGASSSNITFAVIVYVNRPPTTPNIKVVNSTDKNEKTLTAVSSDPDDDDICYHFDWGDGFNTTTPYFSNGTVVSSSHIWFNPGTYVVKIHAIDIHGLRSTPAEVTIIIEDESSATITDNTGDFLSSLSEDMPYEIILVGIFLIITFFALIFIFRKSRAIN